MGLGMTNSFGDSVSSVSIAKNLVDTGAKFRRPCILVSGLLQPRSPRIHGALVIIAIGLDGELELIFCKPDTTDYAEERIHIHC